MLWSATLVAGVLLALPYAAPGLMAGPRAPDFPDQVEEVVLEVSNMTCRSCEVTVSRSLTRLDGVQSAEVTLDPPVAKVKYDPSKVKPEELLAATEGVGFPSREMIQNLIPATEEESDE